MHNYKTEFGSNYMHKRAEHNITLFECLFIHEF